MIRFEVINSGEYWDVVGFNPDNPSAKVIANRCETQAYAEMLAAELNGLDEIEPANNASNEPEAKPKQLIFEDLESEEDERPFRGISFED